MWPGVAHACNFSIPEVQGLEAGLGSLALSQSRLQRETV